MTAYNQCPECDAETNPIVNLADDPLIVRGFSCRNKDCDWKHLQGFWEKE